MYSFRVIAFLANIFLLGHLDASLFLWASLTLTLHKFIVQFYLIYLHSFPIYANVTYSLFGIWLPVWTCKQMLWQHWGQMLVNWTQLQITKLRWLWKFLHFRLSTIITLWSITDFWISGEMLFLSRGYLLKWNQQQREICLNWTLKCRQQLEKWRMFAMRFLVWQGQLARQRWAVCICETHTYTNADLLTQDSDIAWNLYFVWCAHLSKDVCS